MNYELDLQIDQAALAVLRAANMNITIAKPTLDQSSTTVWQAFDPFESNTVTWTEDYGLYCSTIQSLADGTQIKKISDQFPASDNTNYLFDNSATFSPMAGLNPGEGIFGISNTMGYDQYPSLTFGLEQSAMVQGQLIKNPINASLVPSGFNATFEPIVTLYVWLEADSQSSSVISKISDNAIIVTFEGSITQRSLTYDPMGGQFVLN